MSLSRYHQSDRFFQQGHGLGSFLSGIFRYLVPYVSKAGSAVAKTAVKAAASKTGQAIAQTAKTSAKKAALKAVGRAMSGKDVLGGAKEDLKQARLAIGKTLEKAAENGNNGFKKNGEKRKRKAAAINAAAAAAADFPTFPVAKKKKIRKSANSLV